LGNAALGVFSDLSNIQPMKPTRALTFGVIGTSRKVDEYRVPLHPAHLSRLPEALRRCLVFEAGCGEPFDVFDADLSALARGTASLSSLLAELGNVIVAKPVLADLQELKVGGLLWGYVHCAQQRAITQAGIDRKQTRIAFEDMYVWGPAGKEGRHTFCKNTKWPTTALSCTCCISEVSMATMATSARSSSPSPSSALAP
jgi:hypothetical protein